MARDLPAAGRHPAGDRAGRRAGARARRVEQIAARLDDRFRLLTGGSRTALPRQQTLRGRCRLEPRPARPTPERALLRRLAVFAGGFTLEAAEAVGGGDGVAPTRCSTCSAAWSTSRWSSPPNGRHRRRYRLLETVREYAASKLAEAGETARSRARHRSFFARPYDAWAEFTRGPTFRWAALEADNLRVALASARADGDEAGLLRLVAVGGTYWYLTGAPDALEWCELAVAVPEPADVGDRTVVRMMQAVFLGAAGENAARSDQLLADALAIAEEGADLGAQCWVRGFLAESAIAAGRHDVVEDLLAPVLASLAELGQATLTAWTHCLLAELAAARGDLAGACTLVDQGLAAFAPQTDDYRVAHVRGLAAVLASAAGRPEAANTHAAEALRVARSIPGRRHIVMALARATETAVLSARMEPARELLDELLALLREQGTAWWVAEALELTALVLGTERPQVAATLLGAARAVRGDTGQEAGIQPVLAERLAACRDAACAALGQPRYEHSTARGAGLPLNEALAYARTELHRLHVVPDPVAVLQGG